jgi:hypothetical protein
MRRRGDVELQQKDGAKSSDMNPKELATIVARLGDSDLSEVTVEYNRHRHGGHRHVFGIKRALERA